MDDMNLLAAGGSLLLSDIENPNRMSFSGILTYLGVPSDQPPGGSGGRKVMIPVDVGREAAPSLVGMPINLAASLDQHDTDAVIGVIDEWDIGDETPKGYPLNIRGHIFAKSFPNEALTIKASQQTLGFSYETAKTRLDVGIYNGEQIAIARNLVFTGAAILYKMSAAYQSTSLAASSEELEAKTLTKDERTNFALPSQQKFPMPDAEHVRLAWDMVDRAKGLSDVERAEARRNILKRAHELGVDTSDWNKGDMKAEGDDSVEDVKETVESVDSAEVEANVEAPVEAVIETSVEASEAPVVENVEEQAAEVEAATGDDKDAADDKADKYLDKKDVELDTQLVKLLPQVIDAIKSLQEDIKSLKEKDVKAAAEVVEEPEPQRRSMDSTQLMAKFDKGEEDILASIESKEFKRPEDSMAAKLAAFFPSK